MFFEKICTEEINIVYSSPAQQQVSSEAQMTPPPVYIIGNSSITQLIGPTPTLKEERKVNITRFSLITEESLKGRMRIKILHYLLRHD